MLGDIKRLKKGIQWIKNEYYKDKVFFVECLFCGVIGLCIFMTMFYDDNFAIFLSAFWSDVVALEGKITWLVTSANTPYGVGHQLICEIWAVPIVLLYKIFGDVIINSVIAILWYKAIAPVFFALSMKKMYDIAGVLNIENKKYMLLIMCSTVLVALPVLHISQTDAVYLLFMLWGLEGYITDNYKVFLICYMIALPMKYIPLIIVIPLILMKEKRVMYVLRDTLLAVALVPIEEIIRYFANGVVINKHLKGAEHISQTAIDNAEINTQIVDPLTAHFANKILYFEFPGVRKGLTVYTLVFVFAFICIWCYIQKKDEKGMWKEKALYATVISLLAFFLLASPSPYWIVILYPFMFLLLFKKGERSRINMLLQTVFTLGMFLVFVIDTYWVFGGSNTFNWLFFEKLGLVPFCPNLQDGISIAGYLSKLGVDKLMPMITAMVLACAIGFGIINYPTFEYDDGLDEKEQTRLYICFGAFQIISLGLWYIGNVLLVGRLFIGR